MAGSEPPASPRSPRWAAVWLVLLVILVLVTAGLRLLVNDPVSAEESWLAVPDRFAFELRLKAVVMAVVVGVALSGSGVALQALLRNPLAEPFILGLSSGAALGVVTQKLLVIEFGFPLRSTYEAAMVGALLSMAVLYMGARRRHVIDPLALLLTGVVLAMINGSLAVIVRHFLPLGEQYSVSRWMLGYMAEWLPPVVIAVVAAVVGLGMGLLMWQSRAMDVATFPDAEAESLGVNLRLLRGLLFVVSSVMAAGAVVLAGPLAFVGLVCPHLARMAFGPSHRLLLPAAGAVGAVLLLVADGVSRPLDIGHGWMPLGVFTTLIGGPVFLWMLRRQMGR